MTTATASDVYTPSLYNDHHSGSAIHSVRTGSSRRGSEASASIANGGGGYFEPLVTPTMRMEAFIGEEGEKRPRGSYRTRQGRKKDMGYWGVGEGALMPGVDLPDEVVHRSRNPPTGQAGYHNGMQIDGVSIMGEGDFGGKRHVVQGDLGSAFESGNHHFRGF
jgi:hypothetical protein